MKKIVPLILAVSLLSNCAWFCANPELKVAAKAALVTAQAGYNEWTGDAADPAVQNYLRLADIALRYAGVLYYDILCPTIEQVGVAKKLAEEAVKAKP